jgi:hypothetical protein
MIYILPIPSYDAKVWTHAADVLWLHPEQEEFVISAHRHLRTHMSITKYLSVAIVVDHKISFRIRIHKFSSRIRLLKYDGGILRKFFFTQKKDL